MSRLQSLISRLFLGLVACAVLGAGCSSQPQGTSPSSEPKGSAPAVGQSSPPSVTGGELAPSEVATDIVHATRTGHKYHRAGCRYLRSSDIPMERSEAESRGLTPCSVCNP